jgi:hypothetical protein
VRIIAAKPPIHHNRAESAFAHRDVDPDRVVAAVEEGMRKTGYNEFSLLSLSCSDYLSLPSVGIEVSPFATVPQRPRLLTGYAMLLPWPPFMALRHRVDSVSCMSNMFMDCHTLPCFSAYTPTNDSCMSGH